MVRKIVDFNKIDEEVLKLIAEKFPQGYRWKDILTFKNAKGDLIEAIEVRSDDTMYLVKIGAKLDEALAEFMDEFGIEDFDTDILD
jgi:hypothetical protein